MGKFVFFTLVFFCSTSVWSGGLIDLNLPIPKPSKQNGDVIIPLKPGKKPTVYPKKNSPANKSVVTSPSSTQEEYETMPSLPNGAPINPQDTQVNSESQSTDEKSQAELLEQQQEQNERDIVNSVPKQCATQVTQAYERCDVKNYGELQQSQQKLQLLGQVITAAGQAKGCSEGAGVAQGLNAALGTFKAACGQAYTLCSSECKAEVEALEDLKASGNQYATQALLNAKRNQTQCNQLQQVMASATENIFAAIQTNQFAKACKNSLSLGGVAVDDPNVDCSKPGAELKSLICKCTKAQYAMTPECTGNYSDGDGGVTALNRGVDGTEGGVPPLLDDPNFAGAGALGEPGPSKDQEGLANDNKGSGGGGFGGGGSGPNRPGDSARRGKAGSAINTGINAGYYGNNAGMGGGSYGGSQPSAATNARLATPESRKAQVDLRRFLPTDRQITRGLAGTSGPDGITGPHTNIWQKVNTRYFAITPSMRP